MPLGQLLRVRARARGYGAGLTIPIGQERGSLFFGASVVLRRDDTNVNGTPGYCLNF